MWEVSEHGHEEFIETCVSKVFGWELSLKDNNSVEVGNKILRVHTY